MSEFEIKKNNGTKKLGISAVEEESSDFVSVKRNNEQSQDPFFSNNKPSLGMEFLVDEEEQPTGLSQTSMNGDEDDYQHSEPNEFLNEPQQHAEMTYEQIQEEKAKGLSQLKRFQKRGIALDRRLGMEHSLAEIQGEVYRIKKENQIDAGIDYCRQGLMFCVSTIEMANQTYKLGANLNGWSQVIFNDMSSYDDVFEELYEKYYSKMGASPEIKLISMLAGSAFMFHLQKELSGNGAMLGRRQREMSGPSIDTDELLRELNDSDSEDGSIALTEEESVVEPEPEPEPEVKNISVKKKGRPRKNNK